MRTLCFEWPVDCIEFVLNIVLCVCIFLWLWISHISLQHRFVSELPRTPQESHTHRYLVNKVKCFFTSFILFFAHVSGVFYSFDRTHDQNQQGIDPTNFFSFLATASYSRLLGTKDIRRRPQGGTLADPIWRIECRFCLFIGVFDKNKKMRKRTIFSSDYGRASASTNLCWVKSIGTSTCTQMLSLKCSLESPWEVRCKTAQDYNVNHTSSFTYACAIHTDIHMNNREKPQSCQSEERKENQSVAKTTSSAFVSLLQFHMLSILFS